MDFNKNNKLITFFGASLSQLNSIDSNFSNVLECDVPIWIKMAIKVLLKKDTHVDGMWLKSGSIDELNSLLFALTSRLNNLSLSQFTTKTIARLLYLYFKNMPQPLLTFDLHDQFLGGAFPEIFSNEHEHVKYLKAIVELLPDINYNTLKRIIKVLAKVWNDGYSETQKLTVELWGPAILLRDKVHDVYRDVHGSYSLIKLLINHYGTIFAKTQSTTPNNPKTSSSLQHIAVKINKNKLELFKKYLEKVQKVIVDMESFASMFKEVSLIDFKLSLSLIEKKFEFIVTSTDSYIDSISKIIDSYHLERFFGYLLEFHTAIAKCYQENQIERKFNCLRLRSTFEKLCLSMHNELNLFYKHFHPLLYDSLNYSLNTLKSFRSYTVDNIPGEDAKTFWSLTFGEDNFVGNFDVFIQAYETYYKCTVSNDHRFFLSKIVDENNSGCVSVLKFAKLVKLFGPLKDIIPNCTELMQQPWFHGYLTNYEAVRLLEIYDPSTFIVRFSDKDPMAYNINFKNKNGQLFNIKIEVFNESNNLMFQVKEGNTIKRFNKINQIIEHYKTFLHKTVETKLFMIPWFYGDLTTDEASEYLQHEPPGSYLIRFSSKPNCITVDYVNDEGEINVCRLERLPSEQVKFNDLTFNNLDEFMKTNASYFRIPYLHESKVLFTKEELMLNEKDQINHILEDDELSISEKSRHILTKKHSVGQRSSPALLINSLSTNRQLLTKSDKEVVLKKLLKKSSSTNVLELDEESNLYSLFFELQPDTVHSIQKKVHKKILSKSNSIKSKGLKFSRYFAIKDNIHVNSLDFIDLKVTNNYKDILEFKVVTPYVITRHYFLSISPNHGYLETNKQLTFKIAVVLYKPVVLKEVLNIQFKSANNPDEFEHTFSIPIKAIPKKECLMGTINVNDYWVIPDIPEGEILGQGGSGQVRKCNLYGAIVAVKIWDIGKLDDPPLDFTQELNVLLSLRHENLVGFVGAIGKKGKACIAIEYVKGGSLDNFLNFTPVEEINRRIEKGIPLPTKTITLNISVKLNMAIDAAQAMLYLHDNNIIHRDVKSMNFLVEPDTMKLKLADFGESAKKDKIIKESVGSFPWMAPEVYKSKVYSVKADIFSFGLTLYEILTVGYPIRDIKMVEEGEIPPISQEFIDECPDLVGLIKRCCRNNCEKRPSMFMVLKELEAIRSKYQIRQPRRGGFKM